MPKGTRQAGSHAKPPAQTPKAGMRPWAAAPQPAVPAVPPLDGRNVRPAQPACPMTTELASCPTTDLGSQLVKIRRPARAPRRTSQAPRPQMRPSLVGGGRRRRCGHCAGAATAPARSAPRPTKHGRTPSKDLMPGKGQDVLAPGLPDHRPHHTRRRGHKLGVTCTLRRFA